MASYLITTHLGSLLATELLPQAVKEPFHSCHWGWREMTSIEGAIRVVLEWGGTRGRLGRCKGASRWRLWRRNSSDWLVEGDEVWGDETGPLGGKVQCSVEAIVVHGRQNLEQILFLECKLSSLAQQNTRQTTWKSLKIVSKSLKITVYQGAHFFPYSWKKRKRKKKEERRKKRKKKKTC